MFASRCVGQVSFACVFRCFRRVSFACLILSVSAKVVQLKWSQVCMFSSGQVQLEHRQLCRFSSGQDTAGAQATLQVQVRSGFSCSPGPGAHGARAAVYNVAQCRLQVEPGQPSQCCMLVSGQNAARARATFQAQPRSGYKWSSRRWGWVVLAFYVS